MLYELALFSTTTIGAAIGGWIDFKTSEIPDQVPLFIAVSALLLHIANGFFGSGWHMLISGLVVGLIYLALGYAMYYSGQWGEADVLLLAAIGFAIPQPLSFFNALSGPVYGVLFLLNTFMVGAIYSLLYSAAKAFLTKDFFADFMKDIFQQKVKILLISLGFMVLVALVSTLQGIFSLSFIFKNSYPLLFILGFYLIYRFAYCVDRLVFKTKIPASKLREGDVLAEDVEEVGLKGKLFVGLSKEQIRQIQKHKKTVMIKEGVRYAPTFFLSILFTMFFGNSLIALMSLI